jgi:hypothetical protein
MERSNFYGIAAIGTFLVTFLVVYHVYRILRSRSILRNWAAWNGLQVLSFKRCLAWGGFGEGSIKQVVFWVKVRDGAGHERTGWVRCGSRAGLSVGRAEFKLECNAS